MPALGWHLAWLALAMPETTALDEAAVLRELNHVRAAPTAYADELSSDARNYGGRYHLDSLGIPRGSYEGAAAVEAAAAALVRQSPLPALLPDPILRAAARDHVEAQGRGGGIGHGVDGDTPGERVRRHGGDVYVGEVIAYGMHAPADVVRQLIVDDGVAGRGHRRLILSAQYRYAGVWCGPHATQDEMCVIDLAAEPGGRPHIPAN